MKTKTFYEDILSVTFPLKLMLVNCLVSVFIYNEGGTRSNCPNVKSKRIKTSVYLRKIAAGSLITTAWRISIVPASSWLQFGRASLSFYCNCPCPLANNFSTPFTFKIDTYYFHKIFFLCKDRSSLLEVSCKKTHF